jgi:hypothetical protein
MAETRGAVSSDARSGCCTAQVLGSDSANTKTTTTSNAVATATPTGPKSRSATTPMSVAATRWQSRTSSRTGLRKRSGCSTRRTRAWEPLRFSSANVMALIRLIRVSAVSDMARKAAAQMRTKTATSINVSAVLMVCGTAPGVPVRVVP